MNENNRFRIEYKLLTLQEIYGQKVADNYLNYLIGIPPQYWVDADLNFYWDGDKIFSEPNFPIYKFVIRCSMLVYELFS